MPDTESPEHQPIAAQEQAETEQRHALSENDMLKRRVFAVLEHVNLDISALKFVEEQLRTPLFKLLPEQQQQQLKSLNKDLRVTLLRQVNELNAAIEKIGFSPADFAREFPNIIEADAMAEPARKEADAARMEQERQQRSMELQRRLQEDQAARAAQEAAAQAQEQARQSEQTAAKEAESAKTEWIKTSAEKIRQSIGKFHLQAVEGIPADASSPAFAMFLNDRLADAPRELASEIVRLGETTDWRNPASIEETTARRNEILTALETMLANDKDGTLILEPDEDDADTVRLRRPDLRKALGEAKAETIKSRIRQSEPDALELNNGTTVDIEALERYENDTWRQVRSIIGEDEFDLFQDTSVPYKEKAETIPEHALSRLREISELLMALEHSPSKIVQETIKKEISDAITTIRETYSAVFREPKQKSPEQKQEDFFKEFDAIYGEFQQVALQVASAESRKRMDELFVDIIDYETQDPAAIPEALKKQLLDAMLDVYKAANGHELTPDVYYSMPQKQRESSGVNTLNRLAGHLGIRSYMVEQLQKRGDQKIVTQPEAATTPLPDLQTEVTAAKPEPTEKNREIPAEILQALDDLRKVSAADGLNDPDLKRLYELAKTEGNPKEWHPHVQQEILERADELLRANRIDLDPKIAWNAKVAKLADFEPRSALFTRKGIDQHTIKFLQSQSDKLLKKLSKKEETALKAMDSLRAQMDYKPDEHLKPDTTIRVADIEKMLKLAGPEANQADSSRKPERTKSIPQSARAVFDTMEDIRATAGTPEKDVPLVDRYKELIRSPGLPESWPEATINELVDIAQRIMHAGNVPPEIMLQKIEKLKTELPQKRAA